MKHSKSILSICLLVSFASYGQSSFSISVPTIWSDVEVKDNWTPPTAPDYKEHREGSAFGYGVSLNYSFQPKFLIKDKRFSVNVGAGYFKQRFDITRPFNYDSPFLIIVRTNYYSYECWQASLGFKYSYTLLKKYFLSGSATYSLMQSYKQQYVPNASNAGTFPKQVNSSQIDFGKMLSLSVGVNRYLRERFSLCLEIIAPIYTRWRNDQIFDDDPLTFSRPDFSLGSVISISYHIGRHQP